MFVSEKRSKLSLKPAAVVPIYKFSPIWALSVVWNWFVADTPKPILPVDPIYIRFWEFEFTNNSFVNKIVFEFGSVKLKSLAIWIVPSLVMEKRSKSEFVL